MTESLSSKQKKTDQKQNKQKNAVGKAWSVRL